MQCLWRYTLMRTGGIIAVGTLLGLWLEHALIGFAIGVSAALLEQLARLWQLENWLIQKDKDLPPSTVGSWNLIYRHFERLTRRGRKRKRRLNQVLKQVRKAIAALPDAAIILNEDDQTVWFNQAAQDLLGLHRSKDIGLPITQLLRHPQFVGFLAKHETSAVNTAAHFPSPVDPAIALEVRIVPYGKKQRLLLAADISELRRLEQMQRDFVANASHELRTPLTVIVGYLESLQDSEPPTNWQQPLRTIQQQSGRMMQIIEDLLLLSRLENESELLNPQPIAVDTMLHEIIEDAKALNVEQSYQIELRLETTASLYGVAEELHSAFANLIFNAVRHTPAGSRILIRWYQDTEGLHLAVADDGPGIPAQHLPRLTERFYRVDRSRQRSDNRRGTGLGLAIAKHVMQRHDGQLRIESEVDEGSCFYCDFPLKHSVSDESVAPLLTQSEAANDNGERPPTESASA